MPDFFLARGLFTALSLAFCGHDWSSRSLPVFSPSGLLSTLASLCLLWPWTGVPSCIGVLPLWTTVHSRINPEWVSVLCHCYGLFGSCTAVFTVLYCLLG
ncbi:hypothetical protein Pyn_03984 [Prunus yedoensis var. nudiflora]|uniref:Uncharacterized protein n=1 Tax=Prunus yedoensis var. nudiflora TaxID=2094558 RepID=A0A314UYI5_PRUYE|nr:hypothetical protein Pyn_03984 [Prunus yedoensis var. nudiflora]